MKKMKRKIMKTILGPKEKEKRAKRNKEIEEELGEENIVRYITALRLQRASHIMRRTEREMVRRVTQ